jgi:osmotically-inducible protein OsmY
MTIKLFSKIILAGLTVGILQGCLNSAVTAGAQAVYRRHSIQSTINDQYITAKAERAIYLDTNRFKDTRVSVSTFNNVVLISGQVHTELQKMEIERIVKKISGTDKIYDLVTISSPTSALIQVSDSWITTKIKAKLIAMNDIDPSQIKVITENGVVYLMGIIPRDQADIAVDLARSTEGVQSVVKIFYYLTITKA